ncbi:MAG: CHAT domain-containing protein, partial [Proteobacteria bacterium]|nr:CHAT domain-containing protein [Pseudomonadota bacterium]
MLSAPIPPETDKPWRIKLHLEWSDAARKLGELQTQIAELRKAHEIADGQNPQVVDLLASATHLWGDWDGARRLREEILDKKISPAWRFFHAMTLAGYYADSGNTKRALELFASVEERLRQVENRDGGTGTHAHFHWVRGKILSAQGRFVEAEAAQRMAADSHAANQKWRGTAITEQNRYGRNLVASALAGTLAIQGKLPEAEWVQRDTLARSVKETGADSVPTTKVSLELANTILRQGRYGEALTRAESAYAALEKRGVLPSSYTMLYALLLTGWANTLGGDYPRAIAAFERRDVQLRADPKAQGANFGGGSVVWGYALIRGNRAEEALPMLKAHYEVARARSEKSYTTLERAGMYAYALQRAGRADEAARLFESSVSALLESRRRARAADRVDVMAERIVNWIIEGYMESLSARATAGDSVAVAAMFRVADVARGSSVQRALALSAGRASISDPQLAELVRKDQDAGNQHTALNKISEDLLARPPEKQPKQVIADMRRDLEALAATRENLRKEIATRFPDYAQLIEPRPVTVEQVQKLLRGGEVLLSTYTSHDRTYVWAVPQSGAVSFVQAAMSATDIAESVKKLRRALDVGDVSLDAIPNYDVALAYSLYEKLLKPLEDTWKGAHTLIVVPHGGLSQIPFAIFPATPTKGQIRNAGFEDYRSVDWLLKRIAVVQLPSVAALNSLRAMKRAAPAEGAFIGIGDPVFTLGQVTGVSASRRSVVLRNLKVASSGDQAKPGSAADFRRLPPLPDTAQEIAEIAAILKAGDGNILLGAQATESNVKNRRLDEHRVVMFATHGLVPGDLDGLTQPALALSNPAVTGEKDADGLLTMEEVLGLKLNADWVVLSACNTAAGDGAGSEAISGLGRAFFYAGARSLLVSNWPVETV